MTNSGILTVINGDIGATTVSTAVTGFHDAASQCIYTETPLNIGTVNGKIYTALPSRCPNEGTASTLAVATQARTDTLGAYNALAAMPAGANTGNSNLTGKTLAPGTYTAPEGSFLIQGGNLTLDAQGNANAVWVFQMAASLTVDYSERQPLKASSWLAEHRPKTSSGRSALSRRSTHQQVEPW